MIIYGMQGACAELGVTRLDGAILYSTLEPCLMCLGAASLHHISMVVYGCASPKYGACGSAVHPWNARTPLAAYVQPEVVPGVLEAECREVLQSFFRRRRIEQLCRTSAKS